MAAKAEPLSDDKAVEAAKEYLREGNTVEFYEKIAAAILREHPDDPVEFCQEYVQKLRQDKEPTTEGSFNPKKEEDSKYMKKHNVSDFLDKWILALIAEKPGWHKGPGGDVEQGNKERLDFHHKYLTALASKGAGK